MPELLPAVAAALVGALWIVVGLAWTPILAARNVRRLFEGWPTGSVPGNYALGMAAFTFVHFLALAVSLTVAGGQFSLTLMEWLELALGVSAGLVGIAWVGMSFGLPWLGRWRPTGNGYDGRLVLAVGAVWYLVCSGAVVTAISMLAFVLWFPH